MKHVQSRADDPGSRILRRNVLSAFLIKGGALGISLLSTPAFIRYFEDNAVLGVWYTLLSVLLWVLHFDLGIGNGLRTHLTRALASGNRDEVRRTLSAGIFAIGGVSLALLPVGLGLIYSLDLNTLYGIGTDVMDPPVLRLSSLWVFSGLVLRFFLGSVTAILYAKQMAAVNHLLSLGISVLQLVFVLAVTPPDPATGLLWLSGAYALLSNLPLLVAGVCLFLGKLRDCRPRISFVDRTHVRRVMGIGAVYFVCQLLHMVIANTNEFFITVLFDPEATTAYTVAHKLSGLVSMALATALSPVWSLITRAEAEGDTEFLRLTRRRLGRLCLAATLAQVLLAAVWPHALRLWLGEELPPGVAGPSTAVVFAGFGVIFTCTTVLSTLACGLGRMGRQVVCYLIGAGLKVVWVVAVASAVGDWRMVVVANGVALVPYLLVEGRYFWKVYK